MSGDGTVTSGGQRGTNGATGGARRVWIAGGALLVLLVIVHLLVNVSSLIDEAARDGAPLPGWKPWLLEGSSSIGWLAVMPLVALAAVRLRPPRLSWPATAATHLLMTVAVSLLHVAIMVALRKLTHGLIGESYRLGPDLPAALIYEWRKDAVDYVTLALAFAAIDWFAHRAAPVTPASGAETPRIEVRDGSRTIWLAPEDIRWAEAAGNYVELHTAAGTLLHRATLSGLESELAPHGFARIHRSRLVRRAAVRAIETNASGDFDALLSDGTWVGGSRRYRGNLE